MPLSGVAGVHIRHAAAHLSTAARRFSAARASTTRGSHRRATEACAHPEGVLVP